MAMRVFFCHVVRLQSLHFEAQLKEHSLGIKERFSEAQDIPRNGSGNLPKDRFRIMMQEYEVHD